jgi:rRNA maturation protein Rpf1
MGTSNTGRPHRVTCGEPGYLKVSHVRPFGLSAYSQLVSRPSAEEMRKTSPEPDNEIVSLMIVLQDSFRCAFDAIEEILDFRLI